LCMSLIKNKVNIFNLIKDNAALTPDSGDVVFHEIDTILNKKEIAEIDFSGIDFLTTAFLNAAIGQLYSKYTSEELNEFLSIQHMAAPDKVLLRIVIDRAKEYFTNKDKFEQDFSDIQE